MERFRSARAEAAQLEERRTRRAVISLAHRVISDGVTYVADHLLISALTTAVGTFEMVKEGTVQW